VSILYFFFTLLFIIKRFARPKFEIDIPFWKELGRKSIPFMTLFVIGTLFVNLDNIMLSRIAGDAVTGWYSASAKLAHFLKTLPAYFATALFPVLVNLHKSENKGFIYVFNKSSQYMLIMGVPLAVGTTILADKIILLIYGGKFVNSIPVLKILIWTTLFVFIQSICIQALVSINRERDINYIIGAGLLVTIVLYLVLIPKLKHIGVSLSVFSAELLITLWVFTYLSKVKEGITLFSTQTFKIIVASIIMGMFVYLGRNFNLFLCIGAGATIYILLLLLFKAVSKEDWEMIKRIRTAS
ncbi:MAG: polysaccharide biosynthesis C-terminal domain-containing protein, partial [bacterium]